MKKIIVSVLATFALVAGMVAVTPATASAADVEVDMNQACQIQHGLFWQSYLINASDAYSWRCWVPPWGAFRNVSVQGYCTAHGLGTAVVLNPNDAFSWRCRS